MGKPWENHGKLMNMVNLTQDESDFTKRLFLFPGNGDVLRGFDQQKRVWKNRNGKN